jgi:hypothetical protein
MSSDERCRIGSDWIQALGEELEDGGALGGSAAGSRLE